MPDFHRPDPALLARLKTLAGDGGWLVGGDAHRYFDDPRGRFSGQASLVLRPDSTARVSRIVALCNETRTGLIPFGGGTGVVAGQLSPDSGDAVILSLDRMNRIRGYRADDGVLIAEAGCVLETIHAHAAERGMTFPLSMASKGSCTIGGNLATNAGGIQVLRHGNARDLCLGVEAVLATGEILNELSPLRKNNTGYDLRHLLIGSEGTLGVITAATLVLKPAEAETVTAFCALASPADALRVHHRLRRDLGGAVSGLELMSGFGVSLVTGRFPALKPPFATPHPWHLLVEASGAEGLRDRVETALAACLESDLLADAVIAGSEAQRGALWDLRENTPEANRMGGAFCNSDTSVPIGRVGDFITRTHDVLSSIHPGLRVNSYGHIGDGNIHHNVLPPPGIAKKDFLAAHPGIIDTVREAINEVTLEFDGAISAEHGIGRLKRDDLTRHAQGARLTALRAIKRALDPNNILNPGALIG